MTPFALSLSASASAALLAAIWQGSLVALAVWLCLRLLPGLSASVRSSLWLATFAIVFALPFLPAPHMAQPAAAITTAAPLHLDPAWSLALAALWLALSLYRALELTIGALRLRQVARRAVPIAGSPDAAQLVARRYTLCTSPDVDRPSLLGFRSPRILLPTGLAETLTPAALQQVLLHETEHLRRSDDWVNLLQKLALILFPLNPVLLWVERRLCLERELACDDRVLAHAATQPGARKAYATCLTQLAEHSLLHRGIALALGALGSRTRPSELSLRVHRILRAPAPGLSPARTRLATAAVALGILATSVTLARSPRLVSFNPVPTPEVVAVESSTVRVGASPRFINASLTLPPRKPAARRTARRRPVRHAAVVPVERSLWTNTIQQERVAPELQPATRLQQLYVHTVTYLPAAYAAVQTPDGWIFFEL